MRNQPREIPTPIENHPIRPRTPPRVDIVVIQNRELIVRPGDREIEALVVVVLVRVRVGALGLAGLVERGAFREGGADVGGPVAGAAAGVDAGLTGAEGGGDGA